MKTLQVVFQLVEVPEWDTASEADPLAVEFTQYTHDDQRPVVNPALKMLAMQQLYARARNLGRPITPGDAVRVTIYDLKEKRPNLRPVITTWIVCGCGCGDLRQVALNVRQVRPSLN